MSEEEAVFDSLCSPDAVGKGQRSLSLCTHFCKQLIRESAVSPQTLVGAWKRMGGVGGVGGGVCVTLVPAPSPVCLGVSSGTAQGFHHTSLMFN